MKLVISASPHIDSGATTRKIMGDVLIALLPALIAAVIIFGWRALLVTAVCAAACVFFEWGFEKLCHKPSTIDDLSAVVTGVILAYNLPVSIPLWQAVFGCPAHRPLVQTNKLAKAKLAAWRKAQSEKLDAKKEAVK